MIAKLRDLLGRVADVKDGEVWKFPFSRGLHNDLRYGDRHAAPWPLQRVLLEQRWKGGPPELIVMLEAAMKGSGGTDGENSSPEEVPSQGSER